MKGVRQFHSSDDKQFHIRRRTQILRDHPEVRDLFGTNPWSALAIVALVVAQTILAAVLAHQSGWIIGLAAVTIGAVLNHAAFVMIHECTHALVFKRRWGNWVMMLVSNLPFIIPSAASFRKYHLIHHRELGEDDWDADVPFEWEARLIGNSSVRKAFWLFLFPVFYSLRPLKLKNVSFFDKWTITNFFVQILYTTAVYMAFGSGALVYLFAAAMMSIGLHPLGGRWFQEHFVFAPGQESNSYYGIGNHVSFNVGHHVEHHDLSSIPWSRLPRLRELAPEYYLSLRPVRSWTGVVLQFIFDGEVSLYSRVVRNGVAHVQG